MLVTSTLKKPLPVIRWCVKTLIHYMRKEGIPLITTVAIDGKKADLKTILLQWCLQKLRNKIQQNDRQS